MLGKDIVDNDGTFSSGEHSIFLWDNDENRQMICHPVEYPIPLVMVNEGKNNTFNAFL